MEKVTCRLCAASTIRGFSARDLNLTRDRSEFRYRRCIACDSFTLENAPADLRRFYPVSYFEDVLKEDRSSAGLERQTAREAFKLAFVSPFAPGGRLVEVGPAMGAFCNLAKSAGYHVVALEADEGCCEFLRRVVKVETHQTRLPQDVFLRLPPSDAVVMFHVIEHVEYPDTLLRAALRNLRPRGVLVVATPNARAASLRVLKGWSAAVEAPRHLSLISIAGLDKLAESEGARRVLLTTGDPISRETNAFVWRVLAERAAVRFAPVGQRDRCGYWVGRALMAAAEPIERRGIHGTSFTAVYQV